MKKGKRLGPLCFILSACFLAFLYLIPFGSDKRDSPREILNPNYTAFSLPDLNGKMHSIKEWEGQYIILNFWATWCPPCREEIPEFIRLQTKYAQLGLQFIGVAIDDLVPTQTFSQQLKINYPILIGGMEGITLARQYGNLSNTLPFSVIINPSGNIIARKTGLMSKAYILEKTGLSTK